MLHGVRVFDNPGGVPNRKEETNALGAFHSGAFIILSKIAPLCAFDNASESSFPTITKKYRPTGRSQGKLRYSTLFWRE